MGWLVRDRALAKEQLKFRVQFAKGLFTFGLGLAGVFLLFQFTADGRPKGGNCLAKRGIYDVDAYSDRRYRREADDFAGEPCASKDKQCTDYTKLFNMQNLPCTRQVDNRTCEDKDYSDEEAWTKYCIASLKKDYGTNYWKQDIYWCDVKDFPTSVFTIQQRQDGGFMAYAVGLIYMFLALAIVCDEYFVPALECITEKLSLSDDVAGATFMAAGGSAPELFTSIIGVFVADSNVGIGTIVGSAVFNILFVLGMCAFIVGFQKDPKTGKGTVLSLTWFPLTRDCTFYVLSLVVLVVSFSGDSIEWWESLSMICVYVAYVVFMMFNAKIEAKLTKKPETPAPEEVPMSEGAAAQPVIANKWSMAAKAATAHMHFHTRTILGLTTQNPDGADVEGSAGGVVAAYAIARFYAIRRRGGPPGVQQGGSGESNVVRFSAFHMPAARNTKIAKVKPRSMSTPIGGPAALEDFRKKNAGMMSSAKLVESAVKQIDTGLSSTREIESEYFQPDLTESFVYDAANEGLPGNPWRLQCPSVKPGSGFKGFLMFILHVCILPLTICMKYTIPDTRFKSIKSACNGYVFIISFFLSIIWISVFSWLMVWWATRIGETWNIDPALMGLTFLAAGTSVPDLITSVIVARNGQGDMAVSSSIGSNIFDVTIGLPLPWFLWSLFNDFLGKGVSSSGLICSIGLLLLMLVVLVATIVITGWKMNNIMGFMMLILYGVFVAVSLLLEYGTITCPDVFA